MRSFRRLLVAACVLATLIPWQARAAGPLNWDVFVDGQRYTTTLGIGDNITDANVAVEILPATTDAQSFALHVLIVPLLGGSHRVGVGFGGTNIGVDFEGALPATPIDLVLSWGQLGLDSFLGSASASCSGSGSLAVEQNGTSHITGIVASSGTTLTEADPLFIRLASVNDMPRFGFSIDLCGGNVQFDTEDLGDFSSIHLNGVGFQGDITKLPQSLHLKREHIAGWTDGLTLIAPGGMDLAVSGGAGGVQVRLNGRGLQRTSLMWRGSPTPIVRLGIGLVNAGDSASLSASIGFITVGIGATKQANGDLRFSNPPFGTVDVAEGACANAYFNYVAECNLGNSSI